MKVIGITGPTGAGKTTALNTLRDLGAERLDADKLYHGLLKTSGEMKRALVDAFGADILDDRGEVDRKKLAGAVYPARLEELNTITHPFVAEEVDRLLRVAREAKCPAVAIDAIALIESGLARRCDVVVAVLAPLDARIRRIMARDGIDEAYARRRALAQKDDSFFRAHADYVLENWAWDSPKEFSVQARRLFEKILS